MEDARDIIGQTALVKLVNQGDIGFAGIPGDGPFFCKVTAVDQFGLWVENRNFVTMEIRNSKGKYIPKSKQKPERHIVDLLLPWSNIKTVVRFAEESAERIADEVIGEKKEGAAKVGFIT